MQSESVEQTTPGHSTEAIDSRPVRPEDVDFLRDAYATTRSLEMEMVPWGEEQKAAFIHSQFTAQQEHYAAYYPCAAHDILLKEGHPIGQRHINRDAEAIHIIDLILMPEYRNRGIGTRILQDLLNEARETQRTVRVHVETFNPALRLCQRLGFLPLEEIGVYYLMEWRPAS